jgi:hypothetical protein
MIGRRCPAPASRRTWIFMARWSFVNAFVRLPDATQSSGSAGTATAASATAAKPAARKPGAGSDAAPTTGTSEARKESSIIGIGSEDTVIVTPA